MTTAAKRRLTGNLIAASAGTGKTYQLTSRFVALLALGAAPEKMIALTFTNKAAGEFRNRIFQTLADGALGKPDREWPERNAVAVRVWETWTGLHLTKDWQLVSASNPVALFPSAIPVLERAVRERCYPECLSPNPDEPQLPLLDSDCFALLLRRVVNKASDLHLSTLDSFFNRVVAADLHKAGLSSVTPMNALQEQSARRTALLSMLSAGEQSEENHQALLTLFRDIAQEKGGSTLELLEQNIRIYLSLYSEFPNAEPWGQAEPFGLPDCRRAPLLTEEDFAAYEAEICGLAESISWKGKPRCYLKRTFPGIVQKIRSGTFAPSGKMSLWLEEDEEMLPPAEEAVADARLRDLVQELRHACAALFLRRVQEKSSAMYGLLDRYMSAYRQCVLQAGRVTFDDIKQGARRLLASQDAAADESMALRLVSRLDHWMLDEFQDTDPVQWEILSRLLKENAQFGDKSLFVVGDKKQSIYSFRGATSELFEQLRGDVPSPDGYDWQHSVLTNSSLEESRRSVPEITDFTNMVFACIDEVSPEFSQQRCCADNRAKKGYVRVEMLPSDTAAETLSLACESIGAILDELSECLPDGTCRMRRGMTVAVLLKTGNHAREMAAWLRLHRPLLPIQLVEDTLVAEASPLGEMLLSFFLWLQRPADKYRFNLLRVSPLGAVLAEGESRAVSWSRWHQLLDAEGYASLIQRLADLVPSVARDRMMREWFEAACAFDASGGSLEEWILYMRTLSRKAAGTPGCVQLMTMHKSKGAEFDAVILPYIGSKNVDQPRAEGIPSFVSEDKKGILVHPGTGKERSSWEQLLREEERWKKCRREDAYNLMYVALTRARYANYILLPGVEKLPEEPHKEADWILNALAAQDCLPEQGSAVAFGAADWYEDMPDKTQPVRQSETLPDLGAVIPPRRKAKPSSSGEQLAPTVSAAVPASFIDGSAAQLGTEVHALLEQITWWEEDEAPSWYHHPQTTAEKLAAHALHLPEVQELLREFPGAQVYNEQSVEAVTDSTWTSAVIDRLVIYPDGSALIVDYKTDRDTSRESMLAAHSSQMQAYRVLISAALSIPPERVAVKLLAVRDGSLYSV